MYVKGAIVSLLFMQSVFSGELAKPVLFADVGASVSRVCFYENKTYSLGSVILIGDIYLDCVPEKQIETNGRLMWKKISRIEDTEMSK